jgi:hypothetical protein
VTSTPTPAIYWSQCVVSRDNFIGSINIYSMLLLAVDNQPVTNALVILTSPALSGPTTLNYLLTSAGTAEYLVNTGLVYAPGQPYTMTCSYGGATASAALTAPGGITHSLDGTGAVTLSSWSASGNLAGVYVNQQSPFLQTFNVSGVLSSPITIDPAVAYPNSGGYSYEVVTYVQDWSNTVVNGAVPGSSYGIQDQAEVFVTK